jgi:hypothetical protein
MGRSSRSEDCCNPWPRPDYCQAALGRRLLHQPEQLGNSATPSMQSLCHPKNYKVSSSKQPNQLADLWPGQVFFEPIMLYNAMLCFAGAAFNLHVLLPQQKSWHILAFPFPWSCWLWNNPNWIVMSKNPTMSLEEGLGTLRNSNVAMGNHYKDL